MSTNVIDFEMGGVEASFSLWLVELVVIHARMTNDERVDADIKGRLFGGVFRSQRVDHELIPHLHTSELPTGTPVEKSKMEEIRVAESQERTERQMAGKAYQTSSARHLPGDLPLHTFVFH